MCVVEIVQNGILTCLIYAKSLIRDTSFFSTLCLCLNDLEQKVYLPIYLDIQVGFIALLSTVIKMILFSTVIKMIYNTATHVLL